jgi:hypothetical protein
MSEQNAMNFLSGMCVVESEEETRRCREKWKQATDFVKHLSPKEASEVALRELPAGQSAYIEKLRSQPISQQLFGPDPLLREVEIGPLVAFQRHIDTEYGTELASKMQRSEQFLLETCFLVGSWQGSELD